MGILAHYADSVTLVNRTIGAGEFEQPLNVRYDGEDITLKPGENPGIPQVVVEFALKQNPLKGSVHPLNPNKFICMIGVKGSKDDRVGGRHDCTPIPEDVMREAAAKYEALDRSGAWWDEPMSPARLMRKRKEYSPEAARAVIGDGFGSGPKAQAND